MSKNPVFAYARILQISILGGIKQDLEELRLASQNDVRKRSLTGCETKV
jgi:hypothetical protein